jgi:hypothetical protein
MFGTRVAYFSYVAQTFKLLAAIRTRRMTMFINKSEKAHVGREGARKYHSVPMFVALVFAAMIYPHQTHAQIVGSLQADIPFQFHAGNTKLPAGKYVIRMVDDSDLTIMEISRADGSVAGLIQVRSAEANSTPRKSELIFNRYGSQYFLEELFDEGESSGSQVVESNYKKRVGQAVAEAQEHVPAHRVQLQPGN